MCLRCIKQSTELIPTLQCSLDSYRDEFFPSQPLLHMAPDKVHIFISTTSISISSPNPMFDHLFESSHRDDSRLIETILTSGHT